MENLIIYSIIFFIILIGLILLYISLNPVEIKEKPLEVKKNEKFIGTTTDVSETFDITVLQGTAGNHYTITNIGDEKCIVFKQNNQISFERNLENCKILLVGGGGGGGNVLTSSGAGGGGGGGGVIYGTNITIPANTYSIIIGAGGSAGTNGGNTIAFGATAYGGGAGAVGTNGSPTSGSAGGCGGGGAINNGVTRASGSVSGGAVNSAILGTILTSATSYGYSGGFSGYAITGVAGGASGGGGGAGAVGGNGSYNGNAGNGGAGFLCSITGASYNFAGGGGGASYVAGSGGTGGAGGGGGGAKDFATGGTGGGNTFNGNSGNSASGANGGAGVNNTGGGGGGGTYPYGNGGNGGSGVVIIRYKPVVVQPDPSQGRVASTLNFNSITEQEAKEFTTKKTEPVNDAPFASVSTPTDRLGGGFNQTATTFSLYPELIRVVDFNVYYSSYDTSMTVANFMPTPTFLFGAPSFEPAVNYTSAYFRPRRYTPATGEFIDRTNALDINIIDNGITYNNITLLDSNSQPTTNLQTLRGEYIGIKCPTKSNLISYSFTANLAFENLAPGAWVVLGRDKSITESKLTYKLISQSPKVNNDFERQPWSIYYNNAQTKRCYIRDNRDSFDEYLFIFPKLASTDIRANINYGHQLIFKEIKLHSIAPDNIER